MTTGELDDAVFKVDRPDLANAVYHVLQVRQSRRLPCLRSIVPADFSRLRIA